MNVLVLGLRGIPNVEGGIERHAEHLYPRLVGLGCDVELIVRSRYHPPDKPLHYKGVHMTRIWSPRAGSLETIVHTLLGTIYAIIVRPDVLHIHAVGPALFVPLARLFGLQVVVTHHGADYEREKWGRFASWVLRTGERLGMRYATQRIAISRTIAELVADSHHVDCDLIPNGVLIPELPRTHVRPTALALTPGKYALQVSRFVPEKRQLDLIRAFALADLPGWKLALVGNIAQRSDYVTKVISAAHETPNVVLTGYQAGQDLAELFANAGMFVLPSSHEGLPIALLEALSFGLQAIASDIPAHVELELDESHYFALGNIVALAQRLRDFANRTPCDEQVAQRRRWVAARFDWDSVARQTLATYERAA